MAGVEIPVFIDIDKAFDDAARRVSTAINSIRGEVEKNVLDLKLQIGFDEFDSPKFEKLNKILNDLRRNNKINAFTGPAYDLQVLSTALDYAKRKLSDLYAVQSKGETLTASQQQQTQNLRDAIVLLTTEIELRQHSVSLIEEETQKTIQSAFAEERRAHILQQEATTINQLNERLATLQEQLNVSDPGSSIWKNTAKEIQKTTAELDKWNQKLAEMGTKSGSIDRINLKMQELTRKWNAMSKTSKFDADGQLSKSAQKIVADYRNLTEQARKYGQSLEEAAIGAKERTRELGVELDRSNNKLANLINHSLRLVALHSAMRFVRNIREVTAEFELQRVALGGIIQDTEQANLLFRQIKAAAIESPFQIKDLVSYTKQLSAYRIETENLFEVTQRLADVSAGLGVDMSRLILAYGQVRAASVLRGQELRQFTEAGVPLVELLAEKFHELNGRMVSTAEVFELISKRAVPFEMISEIFDDMTDKGGIFYKMQEKQAETLAGQWANLKDAVSIMYDEMGNTSAVHSAMESLISNAKSLMQNWRSVATILKTVGIQYGIVRIASLFLPTLTYNTKLAEKSTIALARAQQLETAQQAKSNVARGIAISQLKTYGKWMEKAAAAQTLFGRGANQLVANFLGGGWIGLAITAASVLVGWFISAREEANRLNKELEKIGTDGALQINRSVSNFQRLADAAVEAADGSNAQNEALEELQRTYGEIIPSQNLQIENLRELKGNYESLTEAIKQKINMQIREQKVNATTDAYSKKITKGRKQAKNLLLQYGLDKEQINAVMEEVQKAVDDGLLTLNSTIDERAEFTEDVIKRLTGITVSLGQGFVDFQGEFHYEANEGIRRSISKLVDVYAGLNKEVEDINNEMNDSVGTMGVYAKAWEDLQKQIKNVTVSQEQFGDKFSFAFKKEKIRKQVELMISAIEDAFSDTGIDISEAFQTEGAIDFKFLSEAAEGSNKWGLQSYIKRIQDNYESAVPPNKMVSVVERKFEELSQAVGLSMNDVQGYLLRGEKDMNEYAKEIASDLEEAKSRVVDFQKQAEDFAKHPGVALPISDEDVSKANAMVDFLTLLTQWLADYSKQTTGSGSRTDPWITNMQDRIKFMQDFKKGYDDLRKYMVGSTALDEETNAMLGRGLSLGLSATEQKRAASDLTTWYSEMITEVSNRLRAKGIQGVTTTDLLGIDTTRRSKDIQDLQKLLQSLWDAKTDFDISQKKNDLEDALKRLSDEIKQSETARNFYKDILDLTGDEELAATMGVTIYGGIGEEFKERIQRQLDDAFSSLDLASLSDETFASLNAAFASQDFGTIMDYIHVFPEEWQKVLKDMASDSEKFNADWVKDILKTYEKTKDFDERITNVRKKEEQKRKEIRENNVLSDEQKETLTASSMQKEARDIADIELEALKNTYEWTEAFKDMERVSTDTLKKLIGLLNEYIEKAGADASPEALKTVTQAMEQAQEQVVVRDAYSQAVAGLGRYISAKKEANRLEKAGKKDTQEYREAQDKAREALMDTEKAVSAVGDSFNTLSSIVSSVSDILNLDELSDGKAVLDGVARGLSLVGTALVFINAMFSLLKSNPVVLGISAIVASVAALSSVISNLKVAKANREIKRQQEIIDDLGYSYNRLGIAIEKAFGSDYIYNYNKQLENLYAQQQAYLAQAEAERSKGKKSDADKVREYENAARDAMNAIEDMQSQVSEFFTGSDVTSAATDFASAWIEAYKEFGSTTDAMREKFQDMIQNMIQNSLAAKIMQSILQPLFDEIDEMSKDNELSASDIAKIASDAPSYIANINNAMTTLMNQLAAAGYNVRQQVGSFTGISRNIANASEESINGLAAGINTQNFYISHIDMTVSAILSALTGGTAGGTDASGNEVVDPYKNQMLAYVASLPQMRDDMASVRSMLEKVIRPLGTTTTHYVAVKI